MIEIREVSSEEMNAVTVAFSSFFAEGGLPGKYDAVACAEYWRNLIDQERSVSLVAVDASGKMVGVYMGLIAPDMLTGQTTAYECVWYVQPEYKGIGVKLHKRWERLCIQRGVTRFIAGHLSNWSCTDMPTLYKQLGYQPYEIIYIKDMKETR
jgi:hypothetical protein